MYSNNTALLPTIIGESLCSDSLSLADGFNDPKKKILLYDWNNVTAGPEELSAFKISLEYNYSIIQVIEKH